MPYKDPEKQKEYHQKYQKEYYIRNRETYAANRDKRRRELKKWLEDYKSHLYCESCGENRIPCLDFHHNDPTKKDMVISKAINDGWSKEHILKEISKCKILCSNCHRVLHASIV